MSTTIGIFFADYVVSLKIMDQSYMEPGISVNFFAEDMTKLPHVRAIGDIISLQNVEVAANISKIIIGAYYITAFFSFSCMWVMILLD